MPILEKISELLRKAVPTLVDDVMIVDADDPEVLDSKKASVEAIALAAKAKGEIYIYAGIAEQTGITTAPGKLILFNTTQGFEGLAFNSSPDKSQNRIVIDKDGAYTVSLSNLSAMGTTNTEFTFEIYVNAIATKRAASRSTTSATATMSVSVGGTLQLNADDIVEIYVNSDDVGGANLTVISAQLIVDR